MKNKKAKTQFKDYDSSKKIAAALIYYIGMGVFTVGLVMPLLLKDWYTLLVVSFMTLVSTFLYFHISLTKGSPGKFLQIIVSILSFMMFPTIMWQTEFPQQAIIYQLITPAIWALALADSKSQNFLPVSAGIVMASIDGLKMSMILGPNQGIQYTLIFLAIYIFIFFISKVYMNSTYFAFNKANEALKIDYLTAAFNRFGVTSKIDELIRSNTPFFLIYVDLDNFKNVNDTLGHKAGDDLLIQLVQLWYKQLWEFKTWVGRLGGDEFAILVESNRKDDVIECFKKMTPKTSQLDSEILKNVTLSAGIVQFPNDSKNAKELLKYADTSLYKAKASGKNTYQFFDKDTFNEIINEYTIKEKAETTLKNSSFYLQYQPQYDVKTRKIYGFESLLRIKNSKINVQELIEVAEKYTLIYDIDLYVLDLATREWQQKVLENPELVISVNISGKHLMMGNIAQDIEFILDKNRFPAKNLCIEVTESAFIKSLKIAKNNLENLNSLGVKIALDDFGMGYSSLAYLSEFEADHIKIEKFFIDKIFSQDKNSNLAEIIIKISHLFNYKVVAEGVETKEQLEYLKDKKCDIIQGYIHSKALDFSDAAKLV